MKFEIATQEFNYLIGTCLNVISQKPAIPILSNFLLEAANGILTISATDLTVGIRCFMEAKIIEEGTTTLPAKRLAQLVRELTSASLELTTNANEIAEIVSNGSRFRLHGMSRTEFPELPELEKAIHFSMKQAELKEVLFRTAFAVSREDNRFILTGVFLSIANGQATFIGTDGKRLARTFLPISIDPAFTGNFVIPLKAIEEAQKNLLEDEAEAKLYLMEDKIAIEANNVTIISKLLSGDYPDINRVIPASAGQAVSLHREELMTLLRQVSLFTGENHVARFTFSTGELNLAAASMEVGDGKVSMPVNYQGPKLEIAFNPFFFLDILRHSKGETVTLGLSDSYNPGIIADQELNHSAVVEAPSLFVLMPLRLNEE
jgi:DNA polymerase III subunit beta